MAAAPWFLPALVGLSALYFADTLLRASLKSFWYDELVTVYLCRLPSFAATWAAVLHGGADLNPPLFYLFTRWSQFFFGEGTIGTRLPEILGFWLFALCLYRFAARRLGALPAAVAALFPVFTLAHYYAYEARPHGMLLGCLGLMLLCWQGARAGRRVALWAFLLWLTYLVALLIHVYAVYLLIPFLFAEAWALLVRRARPHLPTLAALLLAPPCVVPLYRELYANFRSGGYSGMHVHLYELVQHFLVFVLGPALVVLAVFIVLLAWPQPQDGGTQAADVRALSPDEFALALGFAAMPIFGVLGIKISHAYYFDRYFLAATAGYALLLAQATLARRPNARLAVRGLFAFMVALLFADTLIAAYCRWRHADIDQIEPSSRIVFDPSPQAPLLRNPSLLADTSGLDILVTDEPGYLYLYYYAPPRIRGRLVYGAPRDEAFEMLFLDGYRRLAEWGHLDMRLTIYDAFFATHPAFLVYAPNNVAFHSGCGNCTEDFLRAGYTLISVKQDPHNVLESFRKDTAPPAGDGAAAAKRLR